MEVLTDGDRKKIRQSVAKDKVHRALKAIQERHLLRLASDQIGWSSLVSCWRASRPFLRSQQAHGQGKKLRSRS